MAEIPKIEKLTNIPIIDLGDIILRPIRIEDAEEMFLYGSDPEVTKWLTWSSHNTTEDSKASIENYFLKRPSLNVPSAHAIIHKETNTMIGTCDICRVEWESNSGEIGYCISRNHWGKGYVTKACKAVIKFGFEYLNLDVIEIRHHKDNIGSKKVIEKCGFKYIKDVYYKPYDTDIPYYTLSKTEFHKK